MGGGRGRRAEGRAGRREDPRKDRGLPAVGAGDPAAAVGNRGGAADHLVGVRARHDQDVPAAVAYRQQPQRLTPAGPADLPEPALAPDMLTLAAQILESKVADFDPKAFRDRYEDALLAHLKAKQAGAVREEKPTFAAPRRVINLMEALRRSIAQDQKPAGRGAIPATRKWA